jgi:hypothetical protein
VDSKAAAFSKAAGEPETVLALERVVEEWCRETEALLAFRDTDRQVRALRREKLHSRLSEGLGAAALA